MTTTVLTMLYWGGSYFFHFAPFLFNRLSLGGPVLTRPFGFLPIPAFFGITILPEQN